MNSGPLLFVGILLTLASSFWGLLMVPQLQIGRQQAVEIPATGSLYPPARSGLARQGAEVYRAQGCVECHTRQIRPVGGDLQRTGWGLRRTVAQDYLYDSPVLLGNLRLGPDLTNIGTRQTNSTWHLTHLYNPQSTSPGSTMPPYAYLFEKHKLKPGQRPSPEALMVQNAGESGFEIVPKQEATALVAYLISLHSEAPLFEAPLPVTKTNATDTASTNAPAAGAPTNSPPPPK